MTLLFGGSEKIIKSTSMSMELQFPFAFVKKSTRMSVGTQLKDSQESSFILIDHTSPMWMVCREGTSRTSIFQVWPGIGKGHGIFRTPLKAKHLIERVGPMH